MSTASSQTTPGGLPAAPEPEFAIIGARTMRHAATPTLLLDLQVSEPDGRRIYMIALTVQLVVEPARRGYDTATRARLVELFGPPSRSAVTTGTLVLAQLPVLVPAFTGSVVVPVPLPCSADLELAATKFMHALSGGNVPLAAHFNGTVYYEGPDGGLQMALVPWSNSIDVTLPVAVWRETMEHYYPNTGWLSVSARTLEALRHEKLRRNLATLDECMSALLAEAGNE
jgi:hypothetical protein